jgi:hypothetical protein
MVTAAAGAGAALSAKAAAASAAAPLAGASTTSLVAVLKWIGLGAVGGLMISATAGEVGRRASDPDDVVAARPRQAAPSSTVQAREATRPAPTSAWSIPEQPMPGSPAPTVTAASTGIAAQASTPARARGPHAYSSARQTPSAKAAPEANAAPAQDPRARGAPAVTPELTGSESPAERALREEVAALALAKSALNRGAGAAALDAVRAYRVLYPAGRLAPEATYIEMEAALLAGDRARALRIAERLATGTTPSAKRAREILQGR